MCYVSRFPLSLSFCFRLCCIFHLKSATICVRNGICIYIKRNLDVSQRESILVDMPLCTCGILFGRELVGALFIRFSLSPLLKHDGFSRNVHAYLPICIYGEQVRNGTYSKSDPPIKIIYHPLSNNNKYTYSILRTNSNNNTI